MSGIMNSLIEEMADELRSIAIALTLQRDGKIHGH